MPLTADQTAYFESRLGTPLDAPDLETRLLRLLTAPRVAVEVLEIRLATMLRDPLSFAIPGDYQEDRSRNVEHIRSMLELARAEAVEADGGTASSVLTAAAPPAPRWGR